MPYSAKISQTKDKKCMCPSFQWLMSPRGDTWSHFFISTVLSVSGPINPWERPCVSQRIQFPQPITQNAANHLVRTRINMRPMWLRPVGRKKGREGSPSISASYQSTYDVTRTQTTWAVIWLLHDGADCYPHQGYTPKKGWPTSPTSQ